MSSSKEVITFEGIQASSIELLKDLNSIIFPIKYKDNLYRDVLTCGDVTQLAMTSGKCIGAIACRLQMLSDGSAKLYILTLGVLEAYRNKGIGSELLKRSMMVCSCDEVIKHAELHVHTINAGAIRFYKQHGFSSVKILRGYYSKLTPGDAVLLRKDIEHVQETEEMAQL